MILNGKALRNVKDMIEGFDYDRKHKNIICHEIHVCKELKERGYYTKYVGGKFYLFKMTEHERTRTIDEEYERFKNYKKEIENG